MLSTTSKYALRAVVAISQQQDDTLVLGRELAATVGIPRHYLSKVLGTLTRIGILSAARGTKGGYRLARSPAHIALAEIVAAFGGTEREPRCVLNDTHRCGVGHTCKAHTRWASVHSALSEFLDGTRVSDLTEENPKLMGRERRGGLIARGKETRTVSHPRENSVSDRGVKAGSKLKRGGARHD